MFEIFRTRSTFALAVGYIMVSVVACTLPLVHALGYEFSAVLGLLVAFFSGPVALHQFRKFLPTKNQGSLPNPLPVRTFSLIATHFVLLVIPFVILLANGWLVPNCSVFDGAMFFLLIPIMTLVFVTALAVLCCTMFRSGMSFVAYAVIILLLCLHPVVQILTQPQLFAYNHLIGMFVGFSWDEAQPSFRTLLLYRTLTLAYAALMFSVSFEVMRRRFTTTGSRIKVFFVRSLALLSVALLSVGFVFSNELGFSTSSRFLESELGARYTSDHFIIVYSRKSFSSHEILQVAEEHEFRLHQVCKALDEQWEMPIHSYLYPDRETKKRLLGSETSQVARPWMREIHLSADGWRESLKHELVHVVASKFGPYIVHTPVISTLGLTEGLAMAIEWNYGNRTLHQDAAAMLNYGLLPSLRSTMTTGGFLSGASSRSYVASGSFTRWLIDVHGMKLVKRCYKEDNIETVMGSTFDQLQRKWREYLKNIPREMPDSLATLSAFGGQSLFKKVCARVLTEINQNASEAYARGEYEHALRDYSRSDFLSPNPRAVYGQVFAMAKLGRFDAMFSLTTRLLNDPARAASMLPLYLWKGDAAWQLGDSALADESYSFLLRERIAGWPTEVALRRREALRNPSVRDVLMQVYFSELQGRSDSLHEKSLLHLRSANVAGKRSNLLILELAERMAEDSSLRIETVRMLDAARDGRFQYECLLLAGDLFVQLGHLDKAREHYLKALAIHPSPQAQRVVADRIARCDFGMLWRKKKLNSKNG